MHYVLDWDDANYKSIYKKDKNKLAACLLYVIIINVTYYVLFNGTYPMSWMTMSILFT